MDDVELLKWKVDLHLEIVREDIQKSVALLSTPSWKVWVTDKKKREALKFFEAAYDRPTLFYKDDIGLLCVTALARILLGPGAQYGVKGIRYVRPGLIRLLVPALRSEDTRIQQEAQNAVALFRAATKSSSSEVQHVAALVFGNPEIMAAATI